MILNWLPLPSGGDDCANVYLFDARAIAPDDGVLDPAERERASRQARRDLAQRWRTTRGVLRHALSNKVAVPAADVAIEQQGRGQLRVTGTRWHGTVAAGDEWSLVAVADCAIGIDIECIARMADNPMLAKRVLRRDQFERWQQLPADTRAHELAWQWVSKEAYLKALGVGLDLDPAWLIAPPPGGGAMIDSSGLHVPLSVMPLPAPPGHLAALCELREVPRAARLFRFEDGRWGNG